MNFDFTRMNQARHRTLAQLRRWHNLSTRTRLDESALKSEHGRVEAEMVGTEPTVVFKTRLHGRSWSFIGETK